MGHVACFIVFAGFSIWHPMDHVPIFPAFRGIVILTPYEAGQFFFHGVLCVANVADVANVAPFFTLTRWHPFYSL
jgi:hypothetical protein